ncbi:hypothetical protein GCM10010406_13140 [Streptomyces thermolineatus]|uniref:Helix-turn-helix domain-containing protein n=1 Tax=Streptomyces thermolineatus TaxID=44033 RepID=A0ABP5YDM8_9ACTN
MFLPRRTDLLLPPPRPAVRRSAAPRSGAFRAVADGARPVPGGKCCGTDLAETVARKHGRGDHESPERTSHEEARVAETLKKGSRVTGAAREKLAADLKKKYDSGASIRALAEETGRSYGFVHRMLSESGVALRGRGGATRGKARAAAE